MGSEICRGMKSKNITIIDYGMGNLWSVLSALRYLGANPTVKNDPDQIIKAESLLLPGVGSFRSAMTLIKKNNLDQAIVEAVQKKGIKILGICLGMQLMGLSSTEDGNTQGLGIIHGYVDKFNEIGASKVPHIGFDTVEFESNWSLFKGLKKQPEFYFVHSYRMLQGNLTGKCGICNYGSDFLAAYQQNNIFATQFHPEKSQANGLILLKNYLLQ